MSEEKTFRIRVHGDALTGIVREIADRGDVAGVLNVLSGMSTDQALAIIAGNHNMKPECVATGTTSGQVHCSIVSSAPKHWGGRRVADGLQWSENAWRARSASGALGTTPRTVRGGWR